MKVFETGDLSLLQSFFGSSRNVLSVERCVTTQNRSSRRLSSSVTPLYCGYRF